MANLKRFSLFGTFTAIWFFTSAFTFTWFEEPTLKYSVFSADYDSYLHIGADVGQVSVRGNFGVDFPIVSLNVTDWRFDFGLVALTHIYMLPIGIRFAVDNFYAELGPYCAATWRDKLAVRLYPVLHLSAHQADGFDGDLSYKFRAISYESVRFEVQYAPLKWLTVATAYDWFWHHIRRHELRGKLELGVLFKATYAENHWPFLRARMPLWFEGGAKPGIDLTGGYTWQNGKRHHLLSLAVRYHYMPHPGFYFDRAKTHNIGAELRFTL